MNYQKLETEILAAGFENEVFLEELDRRLEAMGYRYSGGKCTCPDGGKHGHHPMCGWEEVRLMKAERIATL